MCITFVSLLFLLSNNELYMFIYILNLIVLLIIN